MSHLPLPEEFSLRDELIDAGTEIELDDAEIIELVAEAFDMTRAEAIHRLQRIDFAKAQA